MLDVGAQCAACAAALGGHTPGGAALKTLSLGYLLSLPAISLAAVGWRCLRPRLAPAQRAGAGFAALTGVFALQLLAAGAIWYGVVAGRIVMTTDYFHALMHAGWSTAITAAGLTVLGASLLVALWSWRRAQPPRRLGSGPRLEHWDPAGTWSAEALAHGLHLYPASGVATAALTGVLQPALLVNPAYWAALSADQRELALGHERQHLLRRDNLRKLVLEGIAMLYSVLPWAVRWAQDYELDSELAVDDSCRRGQREGEYVALVAEAAAFALACAGAAGGCPPTRTATGRPGTKAQLAPGSVSHLTSGGQEPSSGLSHSDLGTRLTTLAAPRRAGSAFAPALSVLACLALSALPALALLCHPVSRCLLACYLGY